MKANLSLSTIFRATWKMGRGRRGNGNKARKANWSNVEKENANWEAYYKELGLIPEDQWNDFKKACQTDLPLTFRITGTAKHAHEVLKSMQDNYIPELNGIEYEGEKLDPPTPLPWYPENLGWQFKVGKQVIRKNKQFSRFQRFLVVETEVGNTSRQEAVSMIPPLVLDVKPHHKVIDLCAAPGSKTAQLIEALHKEDDPMKKQAPSGFVIANDSDYRRSHMLVHQVKRLNSPNFLVTNHDAQFFPKIKVADSAANGGDPYLKFDRVLCDVPCAGDGTMRKNINVWKDWSVGAGLGLHPTQVNILNRGLHMLKAGGRLVYSTCSLNPIENEAVVAEALRTYGNVHLVDCSDLLEGLIRSPGVSKWKVQTKDKVWHDEHEDGILKSFFAPSEEEAERFHLDRCMRVYQHQQNTGGFFIAVFEKDAATEKEEQERPVKKPRVESETKTESLTKPESEVKSENDPEPALIPSSKPAALPRDANEEPFIFLDPHNEVLETCWKFYGVDNEFPKDSMLVRNATGEPVRTIYYVSPSLKPIITLNDTKLKLVYSGIRMFAQQKNDGDCKWRIQSEGIDRIFPYVSDNRVVTASSADTLKELCLETFPKFDRLKEIDADLQSQISNLSEGCAIIRVPVPSTSGGKEGDKWIFPLWKGRGSANLMLSKEDTQELLHRVFKIEDYKGRINRVNDAKEAVNTDTTTEEAQEVTSETKPSESIDASATESEATPLA